MWCSRIAVRRRCIVSRGLLSLARLGVGPAAGCRRLQDGTAELGYRVAERVAGRGVATAVVRELCRLAVSRHGLRELKAATSNANVASQKVLTKAGFVPAGPADPADLGGKAGTWYQRTLAPGRPDHAVVRRHLVNVVACGQADIPIKINNTSRGAH
jgi:hypothetical protein